MFKRTRDYAKDYERNGSAVRYIGKHYYFDMEQSALLWRKAGYLALLLAACAFFIAIGFSGSAALGAGGGRTPIYVVLPYVALLLPLGLGLARAVLLVLKSRLLEYAEYDKYIEQQKGVLLSALFVCGILLLGLLAFLLFGGAKIAGQFTAIAECILCAGCIFFAFRQHHALSGCIAIDEPASVRYDI